MSDFTRQESDSFHGWIFLFAKDRASIFLLFFRNRAFLTHHLFSLHSLSGVRKDKRVAILQLLCVEGATGRRYRFGGWETSNDRYYVNFFHSCQKWYFWFEMMSNGFDYINFDVFVSIITIREINPWLFFFVLLLFIFKT